MSIKRTAIEMYLCLPTLLRTIFVALWYTGLLLLALISASDVPPIPVYARM